ncbi:hypothetical protein ALI144C_38010 [Actinosynnema sp. ALI-1.44]|nr:hypothetical protein ALI144C_38010 [Actinosynnema sp. ALI-1.44]
MRVTGGLGKRRRTLPVVLLAVFAVIAVVFSPFAVWLIGRYGTNSDWQLLSNVGQTYGAVSALVAAIALIGVVVSLIIQSREAKATRASALRGLHVDLLRTAMDDPVYMECWGEYATDSFAAERQFTYVNLIVSYWRSVYDLGEVDDATLSVACGEIFSAMPGRTYWQKVGPRRMKTAPTRRDRRFYEIIDQAYRAAEHRPIVAPPRVAHAPGVRGPASPAVDRKHFVLPFVAGLLFSVVIKALGRVLFRRG